MNQELFETKIVETHVCLEPKELDSNFEEILYQKVKKKLEDTCLKDYGYIYKVISIHKYMFEEIMKMIPNIFFLIEVKINSYLPKIGDKIKINVEFIFNHGIYGGFEKIKVLVPIQTLHDWKLNQEFSHLMLIHKDNIKNTIKKGDIIHVEITNIRFEKQNFSCLAKI